MAKATVVEKLCEWNANNVAVQDRWVAIFKVLKEKNLTITVLPKITEFILCLPGSNAPIERIFSKMNNYSSCEKTNILESTIANALMLQCNFSFSCTEMYDRLLSHRKICEKNHSSDKYVNKQTWMFVLCVKDCEKSEVVLNVSVLLSALYQLK